MGGGGKTMVKTGHGSGRQTTVGVGVVANK